MATTCGAGWPRNVYGFIDYNQNKVFEASEVLASPVALGSGEAPIPVTFAVTPPCSATVGTTRMRLFVVESGSSIEPCLSYSYGTK